jgi:hypothetical protein
MEGRRFMATAPCVAPKVEPVFKKRTLKLCEPKSKSKPVGQKPPVRDVVAEIFEGYEELLGCTSD